MKMPQDKRDKDKRRQVMETRRPDTRCCYTLLFMVVGIFVCVLSFEDVATASFAASSHGDDTSGVFRQPESVSFPLGVDCTQ